MIWESIGAMRIEILGENATMLVTMSVCYARRRSALRIDKIEEAKLRTSSSSASRGRWVAQRRRGGSTSCLGPIFKPSRSHQHGGRHRWSWCPSRSAVPRPARPEDSFLENRPRPPLPPRRQEQVPPQTQGPEGSTSGRTIRRRGQTAARVRVRHCRRSTAVCSRITRR